MYRGNNGTVANQFRNFAFFFVAAATVSFFLFVFTESKKNEDAQLQGEQLDRSEPTSVDETVQKDLDDILANAPTDAEEGTEEGTSNLLLTNEETAALIAPLTQLALDVAATQGLALGVRATGQALDGLRSGSTSKSLWRQGRRLSFRQLKTMRMVQLTKTGSAVQRASAKVALQQVGRRASTASRLLTANGLKAKAMATRAWMLSNPITATLLALQLIAEVSFAVIDTIDPMGYANYIDNATLTTELRRTQREAVRVARENGIELPFLFPLQEAFPEEWDAHVTPVLDGYFYAGLDALSNIPGLEWAEAPPVPRYGREIAAPSGLVVALQNGRRTFSTEDLLGWDLFDITHDDHVAINNRTFRPVDRTGRHWIHVATPDDGRVELVDADVQQALRAGVLPGSTSSREIRAFTRDEVASWNVDVRANSYVVVDGRTYVPIDFAFEFETAMGGDISPVVLRAVNRAYDNAMNSNPTERDKRIYDALTGRGRVPVAYVSLYPSLSTRERRGVSLSREGVRWWNNGGRMGKYWVVTDPQQAVSWGYDLRRVRTSSTLWTEIQRPTTVDDTRRSRAVGQTAVGGTCERSSDCVASAFCHDQSKRCEARRGANGWCWGRDDWCDDAHFCDDQSKECTPKRQEGGQCWNNPNWCADGLSCHENHGDRSKATCSSSPSMAHGTILTLAGRVPGVNANPGVLYRTRDPATRKWHYFRPLGDHKAQWYLHNDYNDHSLAAPSLLGTTWRVHDDEPPNGVELANDALATKLATSRSLTDAQVQRLLGETHLTEAHYVRVGDKYLTPWYFESKPVAIWSSTYMEVDANDTLVPRQHAVAFPQYLPAGYLISFCEKPRHQGGRSIHPTDMCVRFEDGTGEYGVGCLYTDMFCTSMGMKHYYNHNTKESGCRMDGGQALSEAAAGGTTVTRGIFRGIHELGGRVCRACCKIDEYCEDRTCKKKKELGTNVGNSAGWKCLSGIAEGLPSLCRECKVNTDCDGNQKTQANLDCSIPGTCICNRSYGCERKKDNCLHADKSRCTWADTGCHDNGWCKDGFCDIALGQDNRCRVNDNVTNRADGKYCNRDTQCTSGLCVHNRCTARLPACTTVNCRQTVTGTDHPCNRDEDCVAGAYCRKVAGQRNTCRKLSSVTGRPKGEYCEENDQCDGRLCDNWRCAALRENCTKVDKSKCTESTTGCHGDEWCRDGFCDIVVGQPSRCRVQNNVTNRSDGDFCNRDAQCASGLCVNYACTPRLPACTTISCSQTVFGTNHPCNRDVDCVNGAYCRKIAGQRNTCRKVVSAKNRPTREYCEADNQCASGLCRNWLCDNKLANYEGCNGRPDTDCRSGRCGKVGPGGSTYKCCPTSKEVRDHCGNLPNGTKCWHSDQCISNACRGNTCVTLRSEWTACKSSYWGRHGNDVCRSAFGSNAEFRGNASSDVRDCGKRGGTWYTASYQCNRWST